MRLVKFHPSAIEHYNNWATHDIKIYNRIRELIRNILETPFKGVGKPEPLKHQYKGYWSRRITDSHRLIYKVTDEEIIIISCKGHYE